MDKRLISKEDAEKLIFLKHTLQVDGCPFCNSSDVTGEIDKVTKDFCIVNINCLSCQKEWSANYNLQFFK